MYCSQAAQDTPAWKDIYEDTSDKPPDDLEERIE
ncbi:hypothetical protein Gorai_017187 [Gossypium raimondii]|uniref:Uncharacterized protein n=1 Tax=Gossypium raimondii TaxID=29730 RepID=A0A7J8PAZ4_GOSRA|nr:hypothetical protein [Gossypium raimondii]